MQRTGQLMYELLMMHPAISGLQPEYGWEMVYGETADGLMYIGPHRNYPRHLFALGSSDDVGEDSGNYEGGVGGTIVPLLAVQLIVQPILCSL